MQPFGTSSGEFSLDFIIRTAMIRLHRYAGQFHLATQKGIVLSRILLTLG